MRYNYKLSNILSSIDVEQLKVLSKRVKKGKLFILFQLLKKVNGVTFLNEPSGYFSNRWLTCILVDKKKCGISADTVISKLEDEKIETRRLWKPMHMQPIFKEAKFFGNGISNYLFENGICLPSGSNLSSEERKRIKNKLIKIFSIT